MSPQQDPQHGPEQQGQQPLGPEQHGQEQHESQVELLATPPDARDITAELAAAPRRNLPWLTLALAGGVIATLAFAGGVWYEQGNGTTTKASGSNRASGQGGGQGGGGYGRGTGNGGGGTGGQRGGQGGFARGTVQAVDGTTVYLTDANGNTIKVTTAPTTKVQLSKEGTVADLQPGQSVVVVGTPDASGGYSATQLTEGGTVGGFGGGRGGGNPSPSSSPTG